MTLDRLPRRLGVWSLAAVVVGTMIGSGIFRVPAATAADSGAAGAMMLIWVLGGVVALFGALSLAEAAALFPQAGGVYVYLREAYGALTAFLYGWLCLIIIPSGCAAIALVFAEYLGRLAALSEDQVRPVAAVAIVLLVACNCRSVRFGAGIQNLSTAAKVSAVLALTVAAFTLGPPGAGAWAGAPAMLPTSWSGFGLGLVTVLWAYNGWQDGAALAGEARDPQRSMPRALIGGNLAVTAVYLAANAAYLRILSLEEMSRSPLVAADVAVRIVGPIGTSLIAALVCVSTFGALNGVLMVYSRIFFAMAEDRLFFRAVAAVHRRYATPYVALLLLGGLSVAYLASRTFEQLIETFILGSLPFWALAVAAVVVLRRRRPELERPYRTPGYPVVPLLFVSAMAALMLNSLYQHPGATLASLGAVLVGVPLYYWWARRGRTG
jgi:basic amino acid/polyamine antiporter, APA family